MPMRWTTRLGAALTAVTLAGTGPTAAAAAGGGPTGGWVPAPQEEFTLPAGARCAFGIRVAAEVDEVRKLVLTTNPDGSPRRELYTGALIETVTNTDTGAVTRVDASGTSLVSYAADGTMTWYVTGPVLLGFRDDAGSLPKGLWLIDGRFVVRFTADYDKTVTMLHGTTHNVCDDLD